MADENCDISNTEQLTNFVWWIDDDFCEHEDFIGLHSVDKTNADYLVSIGENICTVHSDAFWPFLVHWGLDKPLLKIQRGHIK